MEPDVVREDFPETPEEPPQFEAQRLGAVSPDDEFLPTAQFASTGEEGDPILSLAWQHATGESMPAGELYLQSCLNKESVPTYSLRDVEGLCSYGARAIIYLEMRTNFSNALGHVREAREMFPDDAVLCQGDIFVLNSLRENPPVRPTEEDKAEKRGFFEKLFSTKKKDVSEKKEDKTKRKSKDVTNVDEGQPQSPDTAKEKESDGETPKKEKAKKEFSLFKVFSLPPKKKDSDSDGEKDPEKEDKKKKKKDKSKKAGKADENKAESDPNDAFAEAPGEEPVAA